MEIAPRSLPLLLAAALLAACGGDEEGCGPELARIVEACTWADFPAGEPLEMYVEVDPPDDYCGAWSCTVRRDVTQLYFTLTRDGCASGPGPGVVCEPRPLARCEIPPLAPADYFVKVNREALGKIVVRDGGTEPTCRF